MFFGVARAANAEFEFAERELYELRRMHEAVGSRTKLTFTAGWVATQCQYVSDAGCPQLVQHLAQLPDRCTHARQMGHRLEREGLLERLDEIDGSSPGASPGTIRHRNEGWIQRLQLGSGLHKRRNALIALWWKELKRETGILVLEKFVDSHAAADLPYRSKSEGGRLGLSFISE